MKAIYILFFVIFNTLIFARLTKKIRISAEFRLWMFVILSGILITHFIDPFDFAIANELFIILFGFSIALFVFHFGSIIALEFHTKINSGKEDKRLQTWYNFLIFYVVYILIFVFQVATIIKNWNN